MRLFGGDLCPFPGDGVLHSLQLFQQLLSTGQCVAGFTGARAGNRGGAGGRWLPWRRRWALSRRLGGRGQRTFSVSLGGHGSGSLASGPIHPGGEWGSARNPLIPTSVWRHGHPLTEGGAGPIFVCRQVPLPAALISLLLVEEGEFDVFVGT